MKILMTTKQIKCDTVLCNNNSSYEILTNNYKGTIYLCESCFKKIQKLFKKVDIKNEK